MEIQQLRGRRLRTNILHPLVAEHVGWIDRAQAPALKGLAVCYGPMETLQRDGPWARWRWREK